MRFISSDTNVWIDFQVIDRVELPFRLPFTYIMNEDAIESELLNPEGLKEALVAAGLQSVTLTLEEFLLTQELGAKYKRLSTYDLIALAIAKQRQITLLTGDMPLRKAAEAECVDVIGTIGILDKLYADQYIDRAEYRYCLQELQKRNGGQVRLPKAILEERLRQIE